MTGSTAPTKRIDYILVSDDITVAGIAVPVTTAAGAFFAKAADTQAGASTERRMTALKARFAR